MSREIRVAVVGLGYFGSHHARHYAANPRARLVAVVDADPDRAGGAAERHGAEAHHHHRAVIGKVDAVSVAVPTSHHHQVAAELIDAGIHVFVEKPIAPDAVAARDLVARAAKRGAVLQVGHIERFAPAFRAVQRQARGARLIECVRRAPWTGRSADVDVVLDLMIHDIDLALTLAGAPVVAVEASGVALTGGSCDVAEARLTFANGAVATLTTSRVAERAERTLAVTEPGRRFAADLGAGSLTVVAADGSGVAKADTIVLPRSDNLAAEIDSFLDCVASGTPPLVDGRAGLDALDVAERILAAIAAGGSPAKQTGEPARK